MNRKDWFSYQVWWAVASIGIAASAIAGILFAG
jgi:hypothetical protein